MQLRATAACTMASVALLSSAAYSSSPSFLAAYVANPTTTKNNRHGHNNILKRRIVARSLLLHLEASPLPTSPSSSSEFASKRRTRPKTFAAVNDDENDFTTAATTHSNTETLGAISSSSKTNTGSPLSIIVDNQKEFEINLGRAIDTLRSDYPTLLTKNPSWKIYHSQLEVVDPSGVSLIGLENYKMAFSFIRY